MSNFIEQLAGEGGVFAGRIHVDEGGLNKRVVGETKEEDLSVKIAS